MTQDVARRGGGVACLAAGAAHGQPTEAAARQGRHDVHADGRQRRRRRHAAPARPARPRPPRRSASTAQRAVLGLGAGDDDRPVQARRWPPSRPASRSWAIPATTPSTTWSSRRVDQGIVVTDGNAPLTELQAEVRTKGFGYAGVDLYAGGTLTAQEDDRGRQAQVRRRGAWSTACFSQAERGQSEKGLADTLEKAGLKVDRLEISPGGQQRHLARRAGAGRLPPGAPEPQGDRHAARRHHRRARPRC